jgi:hypothetical protein
MSIKYVKAVENPVKNLAKMLGIGSGPEPVEPVAAEAADDTEIQAIGVDAIAPNPFQPANLQRRKHAGIGRLRPRTRYNPTLVGA